MVHLLQAADKTVVSEDKQLLQQSQLGVGVMIKVFVISYYLYLLTRNLSKMIISFNSYKVNRKYIEIERKDL